MRRAPAALRRSSAARSRALVLLATCAFTACTPTPPAGCPADAAIAPGTSAPPTPDEDIGSVVGTHVAMGSTLGAGNDSHASCGGSNAEERVLLWTAPESGIYIIDTIGSNFDTLLDAVDQCSGRSIACNDDFIPNGPSRVVVSLQAGQRVLLEVEGFGQSAGSYVVNIVHPGPGGDGGGTDAATDAPRPDGAREAGSDVIVGPDAQPDAAVDASDAGGETGALDGASGDVSGDDARDLDAGG